MSEIIAPAFPMMKGNANMAVGAGYFEVPLFSHILGNLWMGCSPSEFPDEHERVDYDLSRTMWIYFDSPVNCHWLVDHHQTEERQIGNVIVPGMTEKISRFDVIFNLFKWGEYVVPINTIRHTFELFDGDEVDAESVEKIAQEVSESLDAGSRVLVHCQAGLNRSSLVVARVLMLRESMTADEAIALIREKRSPVCLCNPNFEAWLRRLDD